MLITLFLGGELNLLIQYVKNQSFTHSDIHVCSVVCHTSEMKAARDSS